MRSRQDFPSWPKPPIVSTMRYSATRFFHHTSICCYPALIEPGTTAQSHATSIDTFQVIGFIDTLDVLILLKSGYLLPHGATLSSRLLGNRQRPHMEHVTHNQHTVDRVDLGRSFTLERFSTFKKKVAADGKEMAQVLAQHLLASPEPSTQHRVLRKHRNHTRELYGRCDKSKRKVIQVERCILVPFEVSKSTQGWVQIETRQTMGFSPRFQVGSVAGFIFFVTNEIQYTHQVRHLLAELPSYADSFRLSSPGAV